MSTAQIFTAVEGSTVRLRVAGRGTFACSQGLRDYAAARIAEGASRLRFDLAECTGMDSTFVGTLAMLALRGRRRATVVELAGARPGVRATIDGLGIADLFELTEAVASPPHGGPAEGLLSGTHDAEGLRSTMLEAHETLITAQPANEPEFRHVIDVLRQGQ